MCIPCPHRSQKTWRRSAGIHSANGIYRWKNRNIKEQKCTGKTKISLPVHFSNLFQIPACMFRRRNPEDLFVGAVKSGVIRKAALGIDRGRRDSLL